MKQHNVLIFSAISLVSMGSMIIATSVKTHSAPAPVNSVVTADAGSLRMNGNALSVTCEGNVRLASTQNTSTLICQRLDVAGQKDKGTMTDAQATGGVKFTMYQTQIRNGVPVEYKIDVTAQSAVKSDNILKLSQGKRGTNRPRFSMVPVDASDNKDRTTFTADSIEIFTDANNEAADAAQRPVKLMRAIGNAAVSAMYFDGKSPVKLNGTAPIILSMFEDKPFSGAQTEQYSQAFRFSMGDEKSAARPHFDLEVTGDDAAKNQNVKLDASEITFYPDAKQDWAQVISLKIDSPAIQEIIASGNVKFSAINTGASTTAPKSPVKMSRQPFGGTDSTSFPTNQFWQGEAERIEYRLERGANTKSDIPSYVVRMSKAKNGIMPHVVLQNRDTGKRVSEMTSDQAFINFTTGEWGFLSDDDTDAKE